MRRSMMVSLAALVIALVAVSAFAQNSHGPKRQDGSGFHARQQTTTPCGIASLTDEQQQAVSALRDAHRPAMAQHHLQLTAKRAELDVLLTAPEVDQAGIEAVSEQITAIRGQMLNQKNEFRRQMFEQTGYLPSGGRHGTMGQGRSGRKMMAGRAMGNCPRGFGPGSQNPSVQ
jgi:Spy/CpxP family protein refolding chaperone